MFKRLALKYGLAAFLAGILWKLGAASVLLVIGQNKAAFGLFFMALAYIVGASYFIFHKKHQKVRKEVST
jgi:hypothetical protein